MNKKWLIGALCMAMVCGCGKKEEETPEVSDEPIIPVKDTNVWVKKIGELGISDAKPLQTFDQIEIPYEGTMVLCDEERIGNPAEWFSEGYDVNAITVESGGKHGIYDYSGNELYAPTVNVHSTPFAKGIALAKFKDAETGEWKYVFGSCNSTISSAIVLEPDFRSVRDVPFENYQFAPYTDTSTIPFFAIVDGTFGVVTPGVNGEGKADGTHSFEPYSGTGLTRNLIVPVMDAMYKTASRVLVFQNGSIGPDVPEYLGKYQPASYANGYYTLKYEDTVVIIRAEDCTQIGWAYHDVKNFANGYAPVKRYGYWALLNENGDEVTDYVFNDISLVCDGKAYVRIGKQWGIINLEQAVERGQNVTWTALFGSETADPVGTLTVQVGDLNFRTGPDIDYEAIGNSVPNSRYPVYETTTASGYTWYRIDEGVWLPSEGSWAIYEEGVFTADEGPNKKVQPVVTQAPKSDGD